MISTYTRVLKQLLREDDRVVIIMAGIGHNSYLEELNQFSDRVFDIGVMEQAAVGIAAGISASGLIPFFSTWAPFLVERAYEQIKIDFGCQCLRGNFAGTGGSFDLASWGDSHYCPADIPILRQIRNLQIVVPGNGEEVAQLLMQSYDNKWPTYYKLSEHQNDISLQVQFGKANIIQKGKKATVIAVGTMLKTVLNAIGNEDITILYYTTIFPFDKELLQENLVNNRVLLCEPYNSSAIVTDVINTFPHLPLKIRLVSMDSQVKCNLGGYSENLKLMGIDEENVVNELQKLLEDIL